MHELFKQDINRPINGVIKVGQHSDDDVQQELQEYIITRELNRYFDQFFSRYVTALSEPTDQIGVWISGFFGSGKSHFLKILSYLLANQPVKGRTPLDYFEDKLHDPSLRAALERAARAPKDVILFNIDSKAATTSRGQETIVETLQKVFDEHLGYFAVAPAIASLERRLDNEGHYQNFQTVYQEEAGVSWREDREHWDFREDTIVAVLQQALSMSETAARNLYANLEPHYTISVERFAQTVKSWLDSQGPQHQLIFMIDEVGQYIGENSELMLNLQTVAEDLGTICRGRAWIVVTSQEDIDSITQNRVRGNDFSKIQGRFKQRMSLSSANTDEVIKLRLLEKTEAATLSLNALYGQHEQSLRSLIRFSQGTSEMPLYKDAADFAQSYPFVPYQFKLLQRVFTAVRLHGASGKHLSEGERSMLDAFQIAAQALKGQPLGALAPFHLFYRAIEGFLDGAVKLVITQAEDYLTPFESALLKTLFMIKYVREIKGTADNLTTLCISHIEEDRLALREQVLAALNRLEAETLIQRSGDIYEFLTHEEQDVGREIKNFTVPPGEVGAELQTLLWAEIFTDKQYRFDPRHDYKFNKVLDGRVFSQQNDELALAIVTPDGDGYAALRDDASAMLRSGAGTEVIFRLPDAESLEAFAELRLLVQTDRYLLQKRSDGLSPSLRTILETRATQNRERRTRVKATFERLIVAADVFVHGNKLALSVSTPREALNAGLKALVEGAFTKLGYVKSHFDMVVQIDDVLQRGKDAVQPDLQGAIPNALAQGEMQRWLQEQQDRYQTVTLRTLEDHFSRRPYGWSREDVFGVLAELLVTSKVELRRAQAAVDIRERDLARTMMSRQGLDTHTLRVPRVVSPQALRVARELLKDYLGNPTPASDPQELYSDFRQRLMTRREKLESHSTRAQQGDYPFAAELKTYAQLLSELLKETSAAAFFEALHDREDAFETLAEESAKIESFFNHQIDLFDHARQTLSALQPDLRYLDEPDLQDNLSEVRRILALEDPTREIPKLSSLLEPIKARISEMIDAGQQQAAQTLQAAIDDASSFARSEGVSDEALPQLLAPLTRLTAMSEARSIDAAIANRTNIQATQQQVKAAIIEHLNAQISQSQTPSRPIKVLRPATLSRKPILETEADIEDYLSSLKEHLLAEVKAGNRLRIE